MIITTVFDPKNGIERCGSNAISSVSSNTSPTGKGGLISEGDVASSRPDSNASMSSWLLDAAGSGAAAGGVTGDGAGLRGGAATFAAAACATGMADGGMSFITGLAAGAAAAGFSGFAGGAAGLESFSAAGGFASSSAMMRRIDAKISSIEGSWTFAGCVISDSTSSTPNPKFVSFCGALSHELEIRKDTRTRHSSGALVEKSFHGPPGQNGNNF